MSRTKQENFNTDEAQGAVTAAPAALEGRILVLAPTGNDARLTTDFLAESGLVSHICRDVSDLCTEIRQGCGTILLAEETLESVSISLLVETLEQQPKWSDIPVAIITSGGEASQTRLRRLAIFGPSGNVTLLERPFRPGTLVSTLEVALRSRQRQYEVRKLAQTTEELMREREAQVQLFDTTLSSIADLAYTFDLEGNWIYANKPLLKLWGKTLAEITGKSSLELGYPRELAHRLKRQVKEVISTRKPVKGETYFTDAAGVEDYHEYIFSPVFAADGSVSAVTGTTRLTTERKRAEGMLRQNEALFSALVELAPTGVYVVDGQFRLQQINARAMPAFAKVEPKIGRDFGEVMAILWGTEVGAQLAGIFRHTLATGEPYRSPRFTEYRHDLNEDKAYEWETQRVALPDGTHGVVCYFNDITETERNKANLAFLAAINDDLLRLDTVDDILNTVCAKICEYLRLCIGCFVEINEAADTSNVTHEWRRPEMPGLIGTYKLSDYLSADFQKVLRAGECFIVRDTAADLRSDATKFAKLKIRSFICVPLIADGRWKFMFDIHDSKPRDWRDDEVGLVRELTARIWARLERVRADSLLRQNEALFAALIEEAPMGVYVINAQFRLQQINTRALPAFEKVEPKMGRTLTEVMHIQWGQEAGDELAAIFRHTLDTGEAYISPGYSNIRADLGEEKTYEWQTRRVTLPNGSHGVVCYFNDITERERAATALRNSEALYRTIGESINYGVWVCDPAGRNTYASESFLQLLGITQEQCSNFGWGEALHPDDIKDTIAAWQDCVRTGGIWDREHRFKGADGKWHHILARGLPVKDSAGKILSWAGINLDITGRKTSEQALIESNERFRLLTEVVEMQVWTANANGELDYANQESVKYLGGDLDRDILGNAWGQFVHPEDLPGTIKNWQKSLASGEPYEIEFRLRAKNGEYCWFLIRAKALRDSAGRISKWLGTNTDIHALKMAQQEAVQASRAKDNFLAALSHELRTPLNPALLIASESADNPELPEAVRLQFENIRKNIELEARLIDDLLDLTRITAGKMILYKSSVDVHVILSDAIATTRAEQQQKNIRLDIHLDAPQSVIKGDAVRLQQVFWNILKNAVKFTPVKGKITLETSITDGCLFIKITDTGIGMNAGEMARVFTAFAQGDHAGSSGSHRFGGLGLGLAITKKLVELHAGKITAQSAGPDQGSTFLIELPLTKETENREKTGGDSPKQTTHETLKAANDSMSILLVEDHEATRTVLAQLLTRRNHKVSAADSMARAREIASQNKFDLLISDIGLPDGNGNDLMSELREKYGLKGIALTGYGMEEDIARGKAAGFVTHLVKPVRIQSLESALMIAKNSG